MTRPRPRHAPRAGGRGCAPRPAPTVEQLEAAVPDNPLKEAYFGETHVHTSYSLDAYIGGARLTPDDAYKFAQGKDVTVNGQTHNIRRPLDWAAVSDHAEFIGEMYSDAGAGRQGRRQPDARGAARAEERGRAAGVVPEVRHQQQPRREPRAPAVLRRAGDDAERVEGHPASRPRATTTSPASSRRWPASSGRRAEQRRKHASQRHLPRPERPGRAALGARHATTRRSSGRGWPSRRRRARGCWRFRTTPTAARA